MPTTVEAVPNVALRDSEAGCQAVGISQSSITARALWALEILQNRLGCTADELAQLLGVTDRAARRYVAILREAGP